MIKYRNTTRPDMGIDCKEKLNLGFIQFILWTIKFHFHYENNIMDILYGKRFKVLKDTKAINNWIKANFQFKPTSLPLSDQ